jgi:hypothetical protein
MGEMAEMARMPKVRIGRNCGLHCCIRKTTTTTKVRSQLLKISSQLELLTIYRIEILTTTLFLEKETRENGRNVHALNSTSRGARERLRDGNGRRGGEHSEAQRGVDEGGGGRQEQHLPN